MSTNQDEPSVSSSGSCAARDAGRLDALKEKFERRANACQDDERYEAMDVWRDAAADVEQLKESMEAPKTEGDEPESTHWEVKYQDWYGVWRDYSDKGISKREEAKRVFEPVFRTPTGGEAGFEELDFNIWCQYGMFGQT